MTWISRRSAAEPEGAFRERIATAVERIHTSKTRTTTEVLDGSGRKRVITGLTRGRDHRLYVESAGRQYEFLMFGEVAYRRLTPPEQLKSGKQWMRMDSLCPGFGGEGWAVYAFAIRTGAMSSSERPVKVEGVRAYRHDFDLVAASRGRAREAAVLSTFLREHHVSRSTLAIYTAVRDGRLVGTEMTSEEFTTCMKPSRTIRSVGLDYGFGVAVPDFWPPMDEHCIVHIAQRMDAPDLE